MSKPTQKHLFLVEVEVEEEIKDLKNVITGRLHSKQGVVGMPRGWPVQYLSKLPQESTGYDEAGEVLKLIPVNFDPMLIPMKPRTKEDEKNLITNPDEEQAFAATMQLQSLGFVWNKDRGWEFDASKVA